jgi:hypothetical protein
MDIDVGNLHGNPVNTGTAPTNPGTSPPMSAEAMPVETMSVDEAVFTVRTVPSWVQPIVNYW